MSESDSMFNVRDRRCTAVQLMPLPIQVMTTGPLLAPSKCKSGLPWITEMYPGWWKLSSRLRLWSLVWLQVRATSCHLTFSKSAWKSTQKCTWMCWRVWWSPGAIRWSVVDPGCGRRTRFRPQVQRDPGLASGVLRLCILSHWPSSSPDLNPLDYFVWSYVENITNMNSHNTKASLIAAIRRAPVGACGKDMLPVPDSYRGGDWGSYIE